MNLQAPALAERAWALVPTTAAPERALERARAFLADGMLCPGGVDVVVPYDGGEMWGATEDRSLLRRLHGLLFVADWRTAHAHMAPDEAARLADAAAAVVREWRSRFGDRSAAPAMAYHDETTAQRLLMLTALDVVLADQPARGEVRDLATATADLLAEDAFYAGANNHGMFQDIALLVHASLATHLPHERREQLLSLSLRRLEGYVATCFTAEGVHVEHSPTYHLMVLRNIALVADVTDQLDVPDVTARIRTVVGRAERYATHAVTPRGVFPPVSDTQQLPLRSPANLAVLRSPAFRHAATCGAEGTAADERVAVFPESGYAVFRSAWGDRDAAYCFFTAAYNGGYHKHSDELSLHVEVAGTEVLREAGPHGYNYTDPFTEYGFSSFAHNTLVVDETSLRRHDGRTDRTWLTDRGSSAERLDVEGVTTRFEGVRFVRRVTASAADLAGTTIIVQDTVESAEQHAYTFRWHLGPDVEAVVHADAVELFRAGEKLLELVVESDVPLDVAVERAQTVPRVSGWTFPEMGRRVPTTTLALTAHAATAHVRTTMRTGGFVLRDRGVRPSGGPWRARSGSTPLHYLLDLPDGDPAGLIVAFSAIGPPYDFTYNYRATLDGLPVARLYVLDDFGTQGAYYHSRYRAPGPYLAVQALLRDVMAELGLGPASTYTAGSSKGGTAALLHGVGAGVAHVVVGAPQTRVGTFLAKAHPEVLRYMAGGTGPGDVLWADGIVRRALADASASTDVTVLVGRGDHHLKGHVEPFVAEARARGLRVRDVVVPGSPHAQIGPVYRQHLRSTLEHLLGGDVLPHCLLRVDDHSLHLTLVPPGGVRCSVKLFRGQEVVASTPYEARDRYDWTGLTPGTYRARVYVRPGRHGEQAAFTTARVTLPGSA